MAENEKDKPEAGSTKTGASVKILACSCTSEFQDRTYGRGMRVHNLAVKGYRCTVCSKGG